MNRPNLLFLYTDEQRFDTLAAYGNDQIEMPNLNRLAESSTVFERAYVTQPVCTPSRSTLLTGLWPHQNGCVRNNIPLAPETPCLPEMLEPGAWATGHHGKWHLGDEIYAQHGFDDWQATEDTYHRFYSDAHDELADRSAYHHWLKAHGVEPESNQLDEAELADQPWLRDRFFRKQIHALREELTRPAFLAESAGRFLRENQGRPWVLYVNFLEPHMPFTSCRDGQYNPADVPLPDGFDAWPAEDASLRARISAAKYYADGYDGQQLADERGWRELIARYWGMNSLIDTHVGRILETLEATGQADDTIIVFTSDHGDMMGSHRLLGKGVLYEPSVRVPLMIRMPGQRTGRRVAGAVSQLDIVPTLLDALDQPIGDHLAGSSLLPVMQGRQPQEDIFIEWINDRQPGEVTPPAAAEGLAPPDQLARALCEDVRTVITPDGWKLNLSSAGWHELYHLPEDPDERTNRIADPACRRRVSDLRARIAAWQQRVGDPLNLPEV
jgi:arylsulfatase A-like enzyme